MPAFVIARALYLLLMLVLGITDYFYQDVHLAFYLLPTLVFFGLLAAGTSKMSLNYFGKVHTELPSGKKEIALTFDDGPCSKYTPEILDLLHEYNAKATFFCIGNSIAGNEALIKRIGDEGHAIGNHSFSHSNFFPLFGKGKITAELLRTNKRLEEIMGQECRIFRPPFGVINPSIAKASKACGMKIIGWNLRSYDGATDDTVKVTGRILKNLKPGSVVLLHDNREKTVAILKEVLEFAKEHNYQFATVHKMYS